jgi:hypothetical protein
MGWRPVAGVIAVLGQDLGEDVHDKGYPHILGQKDFEEAVLGAAQALDPVSRFGVAAIVENPDRGLDPL